MKKNFSKVISLSLALFLSFSPIASNENQFILTAEAHQGRTDSNGGHHDYKNKSGLGSYHYHCGGNPAHLHTNGVCPYAGGGTDNSSNYSTANSGATSNYNAANNAALPTPAPEIPQEIAATEPVVVLGWIKDDVGWWYKESETTYKKDGIFNIDGYYYLFDSNGYMMTGWQTIENDEYYFDANGHMVTGLNYIDGELYYFSSNGKLDDDYFDDDYFDNDYDYFDDDYDDWFE